MRGAIEVVIILVLSSGNLAFGQDAHPGVTFDVASVRTAGPTGLASMRGGPGSRFGPDRIIYENVSLKQVLLTAYGVKVFQIYGPGWIDTARYNIAANVPPGTSPENFKLMLQNLLAERFKLVLHHESREVPIYNLVVSNGGSKLKVSTHPATNSASSFMSTPQNGGARATSKGAPIGSLVLMAEANLGGPVIDKTGLTQTYDFTLDYAPTFAPLREGALKKSGITDSDDFSFANLFTAVQEQLGLKLEKSKAPFDVLVIDHVDKVPTEN